VLNEIGIRIRRLHENAKVSGRELARRVGSAQSYISKIESGKIRPSHSFCVKVARILALKPREKSELLNLVSLYRAEHHPLSKEREALRERQRAIQRLEKECIQFRVFQPILVPGLLQTRQYMDAIFRRYTRDPHELTETVKKRLERQSVLRDKRRSFRFLIAESSILTNVAGYEVMRDQIEELIRLSARPNILISLLGKEVIIPPDAKIPMAGFEILDESVVIMDTLNGYVTFRHPNDVGEHITVFDQLEKLGANGDVFRGKVASLLESIRHLP